MRIAVVGSYGVGLTMRVAGFPVAGETVSGATFSMGPGGKGSNQAIACARLGAQVDFLTAVGDDPFGAQAHQLWREEGVDAAKVRTTQAATMTGFIMVEPDGENRIIIAPGALDELSEADVERFRPELAAADLVVVSMEIPLPAVLAALRIAHAEGTRTLLNPAPAQPLPADAWEWIDVVTPNRSEIAILLGDSGGDTPSEAAKRLQQHSDTIVVLTLGGEGTILATTNGTTWVPPVPVGQVVDTTGAGDAFTGALAYALAAGQPMSVAVAFAAHAGAHAVQTAEVVPSLAYLADLPSFTELTELQN